jgi:hypothetical protein
MGNFFAGCGTRFDARRGVAGGWKMTKLSKDRGFRRRSA